MTPPSTQWWSSPLPSPSRELLRSVSLHYPFNLTHNFTSYSQSWSVSCYLRSRPPALSLLIAPLRPISVLPSVVVSLHRMSWSLKKKKKNYKPKNKTSSFHCEWNCSIALLYVSTSSSMLFCVHSGTCNACHSKIFTE